MASDDFGLDYEVCKDGILFHLRDNIRVLVKYRSEARVQVEMWKDAPSDEDAMLPPLPPDVGDIFNANFRQRLLKTAERAFGNAPNLEDDLGRIALILDQRLGEDEAAKKHQGKTGKQILKELFEGPSVTQRLIEYGEKAELFHDPEGEAYATIPVEGHYETWPLKSKGFRRWLRYRYYAAQKGEEGKDSGAPEAPRAQAVLDAIAQLEAKAQFDGDEHEVFVRVAALRENIYVDLADEGWRAVEITPDGWRVISNPPVKFRRARGMLPLPKPLEGGSVDSLRGFLNLTAEDHDGWRLLLAWLVQAFRPVGPYPVLILQGEQGSAKSTIERILRAILDPSTAPLRTTPRDERDLAISASNSWVLALDNVSKLSPWLSDALCRISTGGGFSTRELYENREEILFDATRPTILNGITDVATRPDLLDRSIIVTLPPIPEEERRPESEMWEEFYEEQPAIFGALLDAVSAALRELPTTYLDAMPRMADFAIWVTAAESGLGWESGAFMQTYAGNREEANQRALEADPVSGAVWDLVRSREEWRGTSTELWRELGKLVQDDVKRTKAWPADARGLSNRMNRLAPALRKIGIEYAEAPREGHSGKKIKTLRRMPEKERQQRQHRRQEEKDPQNEDLEGRQAADASADARARSADAKPDTDANEVPADADENDQRRQKVPSNDDIFATADAADASSWEAENKENGRVANVQRLRAYLENPPRWWVDQAEECIRHGLPERLINPLANSTALDCFGDAFKWREALPLVKAKLGKMRA